MERLTTRFSGKYTELIACDGCVACMQSFTGCDDMEKALEKLADYEDAEEQGLLLRLPCKVGDTVWDNDFGKPCSYEVTGFSFGDLNEDDEWCDEALNQVMVFYSNSNGSVTGRFAVSEIGKTVFLTKSEAEQALANLESEVTNE